ncbi:hypothetical protein DERP_007615 [Dermatophagoides pteronyssinus]|uniref:Uncharacterized protein n=1 Tax=Dermatophagoides pteronyssinus TaxID=6956 RepID=A0ABQ8JK88_DERPT|nr:hypothetical protein DERP_007615 [Dermatophagoides pteronyssinus]
MFSFSIIRINSSSVISYSSSSNVLFVTEIQCVSMYVSASKPATICRNPVRLIVQRSKGMNDCEPIG